MAARKSTLSIRKHLPEAVTRPLRHTPDLAAAREAALEALGAVERARFTLTGTRRLGTSVHPAARALVRAMLAITEASEALGREAAVHGRQDAA